MDKLTKQDLIKFSEKMMKMYQAEIKHNSKNDNHVASNVWYSFERLYCNSSDYQFNEDLANKILKEINDNSHLACVKSLIQFIKNFNN